MKQKRLTLPLVQTSSQCKIALIACLLANAITPTIGFAQQLDDLHLNITPRTIEEAARIRKITTLTTHFDRPQKFEENSAGAASVRVQRNSNAFSLASGNISFDRELDFKVGNGIFRKLWVSSPSSTLASDGLGPLYNARSCQRCHIKDGRGHAPQDEDDNAISFLMRISIPASTEDNKSDIADYLARLPDPNYGGQIQDASLAGHPSEAKIKITYTEEHVDLAGNETAWLRKPEYSLGKLGYGPVHQDAGLSPRVAPQMIGLGLLEAIPAKDILVNVDAEDADGDGISGRANIVMSEQFQKPMLGRFGLKAGKPTLLEQSSAAFSGDIGVSSPLFPNPYGDCTDLQQDCKTAPHGDRDTRAYEIDQEAMDLVTFYSRNLGVPKRRNVGDPTVLRGKEMFYTAKCTACHTPNFVTHRLPDQPEQSFQLIWPYTDMLLHDMGDGLADNVPEARATGMEWRTPPLWGIGLTKNVSGHTYFMHDGRARSLLEAILWHGGEAETSKNLVISMPPSDRAALIQFLESL